MDVSWDLMLLAEVVLIYLVCQARIHKCLSHLSRIDIQTDFWLNDEGTVSSACYVS